MLVVFLSGIALGTLVATITARSNGAVAAPPQIVHINPVPVARPPGCRARLGGFLRLLAILALALFFLRLFLLS